MDGIDIDCNFCNFGTEGFEGVSRGNIGAGLVILEDFGAFETCELRGELHTGWGVYVCVFGFYFREVRLVGLIGCFLRRAEAAREECKIKDRCIFQDEGDGFICRHFFQTLSLRTHRAFDIIGVVRYDGKHKAKDRRTG